MKFKEKIPLFLCYLAAFVTGIKQLREPDVWWQLLAGRWMLEHKQVTHTDVFSYTMAGKPWINVKWLYEIFIAMLEKVCGPLGVILLQGIVNVVIVYLLLKCLAILGKYLQQPVSKFFSVLAVTLFLAVTEYRMAGRPEMISHLLCCLFFFILLKSSEARWKDILWLVPLQCLWANMHEGYPVGIILIGAFATGNILSGLLNKEAAFYKQGLRLLAILGFSILVLLINPNGIQLWKQPFEIYRQVWANKFTTELYSVKNPEYWTLQAKAHVIILCAVMLFWAGRFVTALRNKKGYTVFFTPLKSSYLLLILLFGYLSLTANRNIPFSEIVLFPSVPVLLTWPLNILNARKLAVYTALQKRLFWIAGGLVLLFYISIVNNSFYKYTKSVNRYGIHINMLHNPVGVAAFIKEHNLKGPAFSDYFISSYLLWDNYPDFKSYIDLRDLDIFPDTFFKSYMSFLTEPDKFKMYADFVALDKIYNFNYVALSTSQFVSLQQGLYWLKGYNMVYVDPVSVLFLKQTKENEQINNNVDLQKFSWPHSQDDPVWANVITRICNPFYAGNYEEDEKYAPIHEAMFLSQMQNYPDAINALKPKLANIDERAAYMAMARVYNDYANSAMTKDSVLKYKRIDSARNYYEMAQESK